MNSLSILPTARYSVISAGAVKGYEGFIPDDNHEYKTKKYWDERFAREDTYDWLATFAMFSEALQDALGVRFDQKFLAKPKVLLVGCGNSTFSKELSQAAPDWDLISTDYSQVVVAKMREKYPELVYQVQDMTKLDYPLASFDYVLDKAAMDALVSDEGDAWHPSESSVNSVNDTVLSSAKVLKPGGKLVIVTFQPTHFRRRYLQTAMQVCAEAGFPWEKDMLVKTLDNDVNGMEYSIFTLTRLL